MLKAQLLHYSVQVNLDDHNKLTGYQLDHLFDRLDAIGAVEIDGPGIANRLTVTFDLSLKRLAILRMLEIARQISNICNEVVTC